MKFFYENGNKSIGTSKMKMLRKQIWSLFQWMNDYPKEKFEREELIIKYDKVMQEICSVNNGFAIGSFCLSLIIHVLVTYNQH